MRDGWFRRGEEGMNHGKREQLKERWKMDDPEKQMKEKWGKKAKTRRK